MSQLREQLLKTTYSFLENHDKFTPESVIAHRSASCTHTVLPSTIPMGIRSNAEYSKFVSDSKLIIDSFKLLVVAGTEPIVDEVTRQVTLQLKSHAETDVGLYANEYIWILKFNDDGTEIDKVVEFGDSAYTLDMMPKFADAVQKKINTSL